MARILILLPVLALAALIAHAVGAGDFSRSGAWLLRDPWGQVTLFDLYLGFALSAILIAAIERRFWPALFWITPILFLGNLWTGVWFAARIRTIWARLGHSPEQVMAKPRQNELGTPG